MSTQANQQVANKTKSNAMEGALALIMLSLAGPVVTVKDATVYEAPFPVPHDKEVCNDEKQTGRGKNALV